MKIGSVFEGKLYSPTFGPSQRLTPIWNEHHLKDDLDLLILWGGADISTSYYNQKPNYRSGSDVPSHRDTVEWRVLQLATEFEIPILGVCRGAQLACCFAGGSLWQHVDHHEGMNHKLVLPDGKKLITNSYHHQLMIPPKESVVIATSDIVRSPVKVGNGGSITATDPEPEVVYFPSINCLGIQGHPEWVPYDNELNVYTREWIKEYLNV